MKPDVITLIKRHPHDAPLDLMMKEIGDADIDHVIKEILKYLPDLRALHLDNNHLTDQGAKNLSQHLPDLHNLQLLSIQFNQINEAGAKFLFNVRHKRPGLDILFRGNKIKDAGLMREIEQNSTPPRPDQ